MNLAAAIDAGIRYRRNKMSGLANGSLIYFRAHALTKIMLLFGQFILMRLLLILPAADVEVVVLRALMSLSMSATAWINMASFRKLREGNKDTHEHS